MTKRTRFHFPMHHILSVAATACCALFVCSFTLAAQQATDTLPPDPLFVERDTLGFSLAVKQRRARLVVASGKTYNRVEGLPVYIGPAFVTGATGVRLSTEAFAVLRSAETFKLDSRNLGHLLTAEMRTLASSGVGLRVASYDLVGPVEDWQMPRGEAGIAAFFLHRDYRDHFGRKGASVSANIFSGEVANLDLAFANEWWSSLETRQVLTVLRNNRQWRPNPTMDDGRARLLTVRAQVDTRNDPQLPTTGWLVRAEYENGRADFVELGPTSAAARSSDNLHPRYGRALLDLRRYNRVSPGSQLNFRLVAGGWVHGDELPLQRRLSVGGPATIPGVHFRDARYTPDVYTCSDGTPPPGAPAQCERVLLFQTEYREELPFRPGTILGGTPLRIRSASLTLRPVLVVFFDAGRGWLLPQQFDPIVPLTAVAGARAAGTQRDFAADVAPFPDPVVVDRWRMPPLNTFSADVGAGVDLGLLGAYVAVSLSESRTPVNVFLRARTRF